MNSKNILKLTVTSITALPLVESFAADNAKPKRPLNIIHIMTDDHSFQTISAYGHALSKIAPTPNIDRLADEGLLFTRAYVENSISAPSRATLLTGKYSHLHGQRTLGKGLDSTQTYFTELLQQVGYQTAIVGKWHLSVEPKGFDYYSILNDQGDYYNPEFRTNDSNGKYVREDGYATTLVTDHSLEWLNNRDKSKPFCLLVHHKTPHRNWMPEEKYLNLFDDVEIPVPQTLFDDFSTRCDAAHSQQMMISRDMTISYDLKVDQLKKQETTPWIIRDWNRAMERMTPEQLAAWRKAYDPKNEAMIAANLTGDELTKWKYQRYLKDYLRCIKSLDDQIGRLLDYLESNNLTENTIVVYTSDQGFYMGEHGWFDKRFMYEESFRTPLIVRMPKAAKKGKVCERLVQNIDFAPTFLDMAGVDIPKNMSGVSLRPLLEGKNPKGWRNEIYYHYYDYPAIHMVRRHYGIRTDDYKLIHFYGKGVGKDKGNDMDCWEFYDMRKDNPEVNNLYNDKAYSTVIEELKVRLNKMRNNIGVDE